MPGYDTSKNIMNHASSGLRADSALRILVVEDNDENRELMSEYLSNFGYQVLDLADGSIFFQALECFRPHLVLLDLKLPGIDGYTLLQQIQQRSDWRQVPIIVVSAFAFKADRERAMS